MLPTGSVPPSGGGVGMPLEFFGVHNAVPGQQHDPSIRIPVSRPVANTVQMSAPPDLEGEPTVRLFELVRDLLVPETRETALLELSKNREMLPDLAPTLWYSAGCMMVLLQEIVSVYPALSPVALSPVDSNRVCNALALLQSVASHQDTRSAFLQAHIPLFLYPFLNTTSPKRAFEFLRLTSLGVIGALVKADDVKIIEFLLSTEIIPLCLRIMENGSELSRTVATFVVQKILLFDIGLSYICQTADRFYAVSAVLSNMVMSKPSPRLLKHIIRCYLRLSDHEKAREALQSYLPEPLRDSSLSSLAKSDSVIKKWLQQLQTNVYGRTFV